MRVKFYLTQSMHLKDKPVLKLRKKKLPETTYIKDGKALKRCDGTVNNAGKLTCLDQLCQIEVEPFFIETSYLPKQ